MSAIIQVEDISKLYYVDRTSGQPQQKELRESASEWMRTAWHRLRRGASHGLHSEEFWALSNVTFSLNEGDVLGIVGRNGAGKSTLLKILSRITTPTSGRARIYGRVGSLLEVGTGFHDDLSGRDNVFLNGAILGMSRDEIRNAFDEIVDFAGVGGFIDTPVKRYSSGMRVRLGFAVAAFLQPEILIVDEVLAVGDVEFQRRCLGKLNSVAESGRTVIFVSHNLFAIQQLTNRCLYLERGKLVADGPTEEVIERYLHMYSTLNTAKFTREMHKKSDGVLIEELRILDSTGHIITAPQNYSPLRVCTKFRVERSLPEMIFTLGVDTLDGRSLVRFTTPDDFFGPGPIAPGTYEVSVDFTLPLHAGTYSFFVRIDDSQRLGMWVAELSGVVMFDLLESRPLGVSATKKPYQQALLQLDGTWQAPAYEPL